MASNSSRRSGSSARSAQRKQVHVGTGTHSRKASAHPKVQAGARAKNASAAAGGPKTGGRDSGSRKRQPTAKQLEREQARRQARRAIRLRVAAVVGVVIAVCALWTGISRTQLFEIRKIEVVGNASLPSEDVIALAGVADRETLLRVDEDAIVERLVQSPWIADARVSRRIPSTLRLKVEERVPVGVVDTGTTFWFVDGRARVLGESVPSSATVLPVIRDVPDFVAEPGKVSGSTSLRNALAVLAGISPELRATVRTVSAPSVNETTLLTSSGLEITVGEAVQLAEKSALVADILQERGGGVVFIDIRSIERPISRGVGE
ncbi:MAG: FtsQ-type POTRA domain-containing protein [Actinobacteria bacterium]|nr:FtsQ-type POTRA domain-containing protein [Actinomycetota bacterium]